MLPDNEGKLERDIEEVLKKAEVFVEEILDDPRFADKYIAVRSLYPPDFNARVQVTKLDDPRVDMRREKSELIQSLVGIGDTVKEAYESILTESFGIRGGQYSIWLPAGPNGRETSIIVRLDDGKYVWSPEENGTDFSRENSI